MKKIYRRIRKVFINIFQHDKNIEASNYAYTSRIEEV